MIFHGFSFSLLIFSICIPLRFSTIFFDRKNSFAALTNNKHFFPDSSHVLEICSHAEPEQIVAKKWDGSNRKQGLCESHIFIYTSASKYTCIRWGEINGKRSLTHTREMKWASAQIRRWDVAFAVAKRNNNTNRKLKGHCSPSRRSFCFCRKCWYSLTYIYQYNICFGLPSSYYINHHQQTAHFFPLSPFCNWPKFWLKWKTCLINQYECPLNMTLF